MTGRLKSRALLASALGALALAGTGLGLWFGLDDSSTRAVGSLDPTGRRDPDTLVRDTDLKDVVIRTRTVGSASRGDGPTSVGFDDFWVEVDEAGNPVRSIERAYDASGAQVGTILKSADGRTVTWGPTVPQQPGGEWGCGASVAQGPPLTNRYLPARYREELLPAYGWTAVQGKTLELEALSPAQVLAPIRHYDLTPSKTLLAWRGAGHEVDRYTGELAIPDSDVRFLRLLTIDSETGRPIGWRGVTLDGSGTVTETIESLVLTVEVFPRTAATASVFDTSAEGVSCVGQ